MRKQTEKTEEKTKRERPIVDLAAIAKQAEEKPDVLPRLKFGKGKHDEVVAIVEVLQRDPTSFSYDSRFSGKGETALSLNVQLHDADFDATPGLYSLAFDADPNRGLTAGVMKAWKRQGNTLESVWLRIATRNYEHEQYGTTRGYHVDVVKPGTLVTGASFNPSQE